MDKKLKRKRDLTIWWIDHESKISILFAILFRLALLTLLLILIARLL